jgi:hypothetical protein
MIPLHQMRLIIAESATFRSLVGAADATAALAYIHLLSHPADTAGWLAMVDFGPAFTISREALTNGAPWDSTGTSLLYFKSEPADDEDDDEATIIHANNVGAVLAEMRAQSGVLLSGERLVVLGFDLLGINRPEPEDQGKRRLFESWWSASWRRVVR